MSESLVKRTPVTPVALLSCLSAMVLLAALLPPASLADEGIDIRFDGDKLITNPDAEVKQGKPLILQGEVQKDQSLLQSPPVKFTGFKRETPQAADSAGRAILPSPLKGNVDTTVGRTAPPPQSPLMLKGAVSTNVPRTPDDVSDYLRKMRALIKGYQTAAMNDIFHGGSRVDMQNLNVSQVQGETISMINAIRSIVPPAEMKQEHYQLADALSAVLNLLVPAGEHIQNPLAILDKIGPIIRYLTKVMDRYHAGVLNVIAAYQLPASLDPLGGEKQSDDILLENAFADLSNQLLSKEKAAYGQQGSGGDNANLSNMLGQSADDLQGIRQLMGGSGGDLSTLANLLGSSGASSGSPAQGMLRNLGAGGTGGMDIGQVQRLLQGLGGGSAGSGSDSDMGTSGGFDQSP